jgi:uncharacterized membrane protein YccC
MAGPGQFGPSSRRLCGRGFAVEGFRTVETTYHLHRLGRSFRLWYSAIAPQMLRPWWPTEAGNAVRIGLTSVVAVYLAMLLELDRPEWAGWTVLSVSLATRASSLQKSLWRAVSSITGCVIAIALTANFAQSTLAFDAALALWLGLLTAPASVERGQRSYGFALMGYTVPIVALSNVDQPDLVFQVAADRCSTLLLGVACAHASSVLVAPGVREVSSSLASGLNAAVTACGEWLLAVQRGGNVPEPPVSQVLALDPAVADAFTEQSSLQTGRRAVNDAPMRLLHVLTIGLLELRLGLRDGSEASALLGNHFADWGRQLRLVRSASRLLRAGRWAGNRHTPVRPLSIDRDGRQAFNNAVRTAAAVSLANGFWYVSGWPSGAAAVTWAALASMLLAARPNPVIATRNFLVGAVLAVVVGVVVHYGILTTSGNFPLLAAVLLPVCMLAALGRSDARAVSGGGYGLVVLNIIEPTNVMRYQLAATLNEVVANLLGLGLAVIAFSALPPPASASTRRWRARRRMAKGFLASVRAPDFLCPDTDRWLARMFDRLNKIGGEDGAADGGQTLLLAGLLVLTLRREDADLGRQVRAIVQAKGLRAGSALRQLASHVDRTALQHDRVVALSLLIGADELKFWPGLEGEHAS